MHCLFISSLLCIGKRRNANILQWREYCFLATIDMVVVNGGLRHISFFMDICERVSDRELFLYSSTVKRV
jgi:hypothetical protein